MHHGVSSGSRRRVRVYGGRAAAAAGRPPRDRGRARHRRLATRARPWASCIPALRGRLRATSRYAPLDAGRPRRPRPRVLRAAARREPGAAARICSTTSATSSISAPTSGCRPTCTRAGTASRTARPRSSTGSRTGSSSCTATSIATHAHVASPGCYPTAVEPRVRAAARARARRAAASSPTRCRACRARAAASRPRACSRRRTRTSSAYGLLTHRHTAEMEQALAKVARQPVQRAVHAAPRADDARHPRDLLRAPVDRRACRPRGCSSTTASSTPTIRAWSWSTSRRARRRRYGANVAHVTVRFDERTDTVVAIAARGQPREGRVGPDDPGREPRARPARDDRPAAARDPAVSVTAAQGFVAGGLACGIKESGAPDLALVATDDRAPGARGRRVHDEPRAGRAGAGLARASRRRARRGGGAQLRQRQRGDRRAGPARRAPHVRARRPRASALRTDRRARVLDRLIGIPMPMDALEAGIPKLCGDARAPTAAPTPPRRS